MKKSLLFISSLIASASFGQISLDATDFIDVNDEIISTVDSTTNVTIIPAGADQTFDFSAISDQKRDTADAKDPSTTPNGASYPSANIALELNLITIKALAYVNKTSTEAEIVGAIYKNTRVNFADPQRLYEFPLNYGNYFSDDFEYTAIGPGTDFGQPFDSVKLEVKGTIKRGVDSWGKLINSIDTFDVLRIADTTYDTNVISIWSGGMWNVFTTEDQISYTHTYETNNAGVAFTLLAHDVDAAGALAGRINWEYSEPAYVGINEASAFEFGIYPNPSTDIINVTTKEEINAYTIVDLQGKIVASYVGTFSKIIDVSNLTKGSYILTLQTSKGTSSKMITKK